MKRFIKNTAGVALIASILTIGAHAQNQAGAAGDLATIATLSTKVKADLAVAARDNDVDQVIELKKRSNAIDIAMSEANAAFAAMDAAVKAGDTAAAEAAMKTVVASVTKAENASKGIMSDELAAAASEADFSPNIYNIPSQTEEMQTFYQSHWDSVFASGRSAGDSPATPE